MQVQFQQGKNSLRYHPQMEKDKEPPDKRGHYWKDRRGVKPFNPNTYMKIQGTYGTLLSYDHDCDNMLKRGIEAAWNMQKINQFRQQNFVRLNSVKEKISKLQNECIERDEKDKFKFIETDGVKDFAFKSPELKEEYEFKVKELLNTDCEILI